MDNLFDLPAELPSGELVEVILARPGLRIERIVSHGQSSPPGFWYDQSEHEWVMLLKGFARLRFEDRVIELKAGDQLNIPANCRHRVEWTMPNEPTIWLAVFYD